MGHDASANDEVGKGLVEREIIKLVNKTNSNEAVCGIKNGGAEVETQDDTSSLQRSNINYVNQEDFGCPLVEGEVQKFDDTICPHGIIYNLKNCETEIDLRCLHDAYITTKDSDRKTNVNAAHFLDQVPSLNFKYLNGIPNQFLATYPTFQVKSSDFNIHEMVASDTIERKLKPSEKKGLVADAEELIEFYSKDLEVFEIKDLEVETDFDLSTLGDIVGSCNMKESMQCVKSYTISGGEYKTRLFKTTSHGATCLNQ